MSEKTALIFPITFNLSLKVKTAPDLISSDGGAVPLREIDKRLKFTDRLAKKLIDRREKSLVIFKFSELLRTRIFLIAQGWKDENDADRLRRDPAFRAAVSTLKGQSPLKPAAERGKTEGLASQPTLSRLTGALATDENLETLNNELAANNLQFIKTTRKRRFRHATIDVDSFPLETYGNQMGSRHNGYYRYRCYHPLVAMLAETGNIIKVKLRDGHCHTADGLVDFLSPLIKNVKGKIAQSISVRGDAGMPSETLFNLLEKKHKVKYCFRLKTNAVLDRLAKPFLAEFEKQPKCSRKEMAVELTYRAASWSRARRVVLMIVDESGQLDFFKPYNYFFLVTNWTEDKKSGLDLLEFYRQRGTMERWIGEFKDVLAPSLSCSTRPRGDNIELTRDDFACNEALLMLNALAYNLMNISRRLMERATGDGWSLRRFREQVLKSAVRFSLSGRQIFAWVAEPAAKLWHLLGGAIASLHPV